ncbi:MAG: FAD-dependent oxidoreductase, partial [Planctomycetota bacterium]
MIKRAGREKPQMLVDPFRRPGKLFATALSSAATIGDKWKVAQLRKFVGGQTPEQLLAGPEQTTQAFLEEFGFSSRIIENFFRPFYGGISLDSSLSVSSRFFLWTFKLFGTGQTTLPAAGMGQLPKHLAQRLKKTQFRMGMAVKRINGNTLITEGGEQVKGAAVVIATSAPAAAELLRMAGRDGDLEVRPAKKTATLYYASDEPPFQENLLLLAGDDEACRPINSVAVLTNAAPSYAPIGQSLMSVSVVDVPSDVEAAVAKALPNLCGESAASWHHLKTYHIDYALPDQSPPWSPGSKSRDLGDGLFVCGDHLETASINGALVSGRSCGEAVLAHLGHAPKPA